MFSCWDVLSSVALFNQLFKALLFHHVTTLPVM